MKIKQKVLPGVGAAYEAFVVSLPFLSAVQFLTILTVFYREVREFLLPVTPWVTFPVFLAFVVILLAITMFLVYRFLIPSIWTFRGRQLYGFESELMDEVRKLREELEKLREKEEACHSKETTTST